jgi:hypothetical protein
VDVELLVLSGVTSSWLHRFHLVPSQQTWDGNCGKPERFELGPRSELQCVTRKKRAGGDVYGFMVDIATYYSNSKLLCICHFCYQYCIKPNTSMWLDLVGYARITTVTSRPSNGISLISRQDESLFE